MNRHVLLAAALLFGASVRAAETPSFLIESIRVEGIRYISPKIVIAESKLVTGHSYSEPQLRDAVSRVQRLPFVVHTDIRLEKGSERGRYVLVVVIEETKPFFIDYRSVFDTYAGRYRSRQSIDPATGLPTFQYLSLLRNHQEYPNLGARMFIGPKGMLSASAAMDGSDPFVTGDNRYSLAWTQYDLFNTRASVALVATYKEYSFDFTLRPDFGGPLTSSFGDHLMWDLTAAVPLSGNNAIRALWHREQKLDNINPDGNDKFIRRPIDNMQLSWVYNTTNDLLFPTRGSYGEIGWESDKRLLRVTIPRHPSWADEDTYWEQFLDVHGRRYRELSERQSVFAGGDFRYRGETDYYDVQARAGYTASLWRSRSFGYSDLRLLAEADHVRIRDGGSYSIARAGLALRNSWGVARIDFSYSGWRHAP